MASNRKHPFGYTMRMGTICISDQEADLVRMIYERYAAGASYNQLTERLNMQEVSYSSPQKPWNKNMVARILASPLYVGNDTYPAIITKELHSKASCMKPSCKQDSSQTTKAIRKLAQCAQCNGRLELSSNKHGWARWNCPTCNALTVEATTPRIVDELKAILTLIRNSPDTVRAPQEEDPIKSSALAQAAQQFAESLSYEEFDEENAKDCVMALASARFDAIGSESYESMRIHSILSQATPTTELDTELLCQITTAVLIHPNGAVSLQLKNEQIIERSQEK